MGTECKVMLLGGTSQLGFSIVRRYPVDALCRVVREWKPDLVLYCAGICNVGKCERSPDFAWAINVESVRVLLKAVPRSVRLVYCSSDHVFGGDRGPYREGDTPRPISVYGRTRVAAEAAILKARPDALIVRHGLGIGPSVGGRSGHLDWLRRRTKLDLPTTVISDEVRSAVWSEDLADRVWNLAHSDLSGIRHVVATAASSRVELAKYHDARFGIGANLQVATPGEQRDPHIGNVELSTDYSDSLARPLEAVVITDSGCARPTVDPSSRSIRCRPE
jgi:dTDP-4-dehydrorhamnose reductase